MLTTERGRILRSDSVRKVDVAGTHAASLARCSAGIAARPRPSTTSCQFLNLRSQKSHATLVHCNAQPPQSIPDNDLASNIATANRGVIQRAQTAGQATTSLPCRVRACGHGL